MILEAITIENFRGFAEQRIFEFENNVLIVLTAPNGKGKTTLMDAIEWCLTGDIKRIHEAFNRRNTNAAEKNANRDAILKNKKHINEMTSVQLVITNSKERYIVVRTQGEDTLENKGILSVNGMYGDDAECQLEKIIDSQNFYKYHFCDMQKTYNFLNKGRGELEGEFEDFSADYSVAENVVNNLWNYQNDIRTIISDLDKEKTIAESTQKTYQDILQKYETRPEILPYNKRVIYANECTELKNFTEAQLEESLAKLYKCGYARVLSLLEDKSKSSAAEKRKSQLEILHRELETNEDEINKAIKNGANKEETRAKAEEALRKCYDIKLAPENLEKNKEELIQFRSEFFSEDYWKDSSAKLKQIKEFKKNLTDEIGSLNKGSKIIDILTSITAGKNGLIQYRTELRGSQQKCPVLCPVCGSDQFDKLEEDEIAQQAQNYQTENKNLIEKKKKDLDKLKEQEFEILGGQLEKAKLALDEATTKAKQEVERLNKLHEITKKYFLTQQKLQQENQKVYSSENMLFIKNITAAMAENEKDILTNEKITLLDTEVQKVLNYINFSSKEELSESGLLEEVRNRTVNAPTGITYNEMLLVDKISSIRSIMNNKQVLEATKFLNDAQNKNKLVTEEIQRLQRLENKVKKRIKDINDKKDELKQVEYEQVGPYLYKIFCKLSRDVQIEEIRLENIKGASCIIQI